MAQSGFASELALGLRTIHAASLLTKRVLRSLKNNVSAEAKADDSPVTIADFAAQALIIGALHAVYPDDSFVGEESAGALRRNEGLCESVWQLVQQAKNQKSEVQHAWGHDGDTTSREGELVIPETKEDMLDVIDLGTSDQTAKGRVWVLDPVDGTATFMQGHQYAVCLCLLVDGVQQVGVIGCPNLKLNTDGPLGQTRIHEDQVDEEGYGVVLSAVKGQGTWVRSMSAMGLGEAKQIKHEAIVKNVQELNFVEATIGKTTLSQAEHGAVAEHLGAQWPGTVIWSQQMKHVALALGATDVMLRLPKNKERFTHIWDHAGGHLLFQETGVTVKDIEGGEIDYAQGRRILGDRNYGMVAARANVFDQVMEGVNTVLGRRTRS
jgi:3'(2'), 5'-bisphosphate nucleotidase